MSTALRITVADLDRMIAAGAFDGPDRRRVELIEGELLDMSPIGPLHEDVLDRLAEWSFQVVPRKRFRIRVQNSVGVPELDSAPEPDLAWVDRLDYSRARPTPGNVRLIVEVADTSLAHDRGRKSRLYAQAGVADYWIVDVHAQTVEVRRDPEGDRFRRIVIVDRNGTVAPLALPEAVLSVATLFPAQEPPR